jgi:tetratricopeptide (TPR) repeat protein
VEINPNRADSLLNFGNALVQKGQLDEAIARLDKAIEINPAYADARNSLGVALVKKGQMDEAIAQFEEALRIRPDLRPAQVNLARVRAMVRQSDGHE